MPDSTTPPALDAKAIAETISAVVAAQLKPLTEQLAKLSTASAPPPAAAAAPAATAAAAATDAPLTAAQFQKMLDDRDRQTSARNDLLAAKGRFSAEKLKDLPEIYRGKLGDDPARWTDEEQSIRNQFKSDFKAAGGRVGDLGGEQDPTGTASVLAPVDMSKMTPSQKIELGLKQSKSARPPSAVTTRDRPAAEVATVETH